MATLRPAFAEFLHELACYAAEFGNHVIGREDAAVMAIHGLDRSGVPNLPLQLRSSPRSGLRGDRNRQHHALLSRRTGVETLYITKYSIPRLRSKYSMFVQLKMPDAVFGITISSPTVPTSSMTFDSHDTAEPV
ncbi:hypothetical protein [Mesorhizobium sp.]|uniref:hypothetical protein n=1 Tax=Mesorhizobium sp. TaxID=1871066 RepID=UPI00257DA486|nr:hypothetical protein [Mesorhizobium sp.]